jgi:hypothetical protein
VGDVIKAKAWKEGILKKADLRQGASGEGGASPPVQRIGPVQNSEGIRGGRKRALAGEALGGAGFGFGRFLFAILGRGAGFEGPEEADGDGGDFVDGRLEGCFVRLGWLVEAGDFSDELERSRADFVIGDRRIEIEERFYISAHWIDSPLRLRKSLLTSLAKQGAGILRPYIGPASITHCSIQFGDPACRFSVA